MELSGGEGFRNKLKVKVQKNIKAAVEVLGELTAWVSSLTPCLSPAYVQRQEENYIAVRPI